MDLLTFSGTLILILLSMLGYFLAHLHNRVEEHLKESVRDQIDLEALRGEVKAMRERQEDFYNQLDQIGEKVDAIPEKIFSYFRELKKV